MDNLAQSFGSYRPRLVQAHEETVIQRKPMPDKSGYLTVALHHNIFPAPTVRRHPDPQLQPPATLLLLPFLLDSVAIQAKRISTISMVYVFSILWRSYRLNSNLLQQALNQWCAVLNPSCRSFLLFLDHCCNYSVWSDVLGEISCLLVLLHDVNTLSSPLMVIHHLVRHLAGALCPVSVVVWKAGPSSSPYIVEIQGRTGDEGQSWWNNHRLEKITL